MNEASVSTHSGPVRPTAEQASRPRLPGPTSAAGKGDGPGLASGRAQGLLGPRERGQVPGRLDDGVSGPLWNLPSLWGLWQLPSGPEATGLSSSACCPAPTEACRAGGARACSLAPAPPPSSLPTARGLPFLQASTSSCGTWRGATHPARHPPGPHPHMAVRVNQRLPGSLGTLGLEWPGRGWVSERRPTAALGGPSPGPGCGSRGRAGAGRGTGSHHTSSSGPGLRKLFLQLCPALT